MFATSATVLESMPYCHEVLVERYLGSLIPEYGKIDNDYKSFNTRTIRSSPANRGTTCIGRVCGFSFSLTLCLVLPATQYQVQLMYQHGSATPDTFSRLPATRFLPPLRFPAQQQSERTGNSLLQSLKDINVRFLLTAGQVQPVRLPDFPEC